MSDLTCPGIYHFGCVRPQKNLAVLGEGWEEGGVHVLAVLELCCEIIAWKKTYELLKRTVYLGVR